TSPATTATRRTSFRAACSGTRPRGSEPDTAHLDSDLGRPRRGGDQRHRPPEVCVAESEDPAVPGHQPVAAPRSGGGDPCHLLVETDATGGAQKAGISEREDTSVGGHEPVSPALWRGGHGDHRLRQPDTACG